MVLLWHRCGIDVVLLFCCGNAAASPWDCSGFAVELLGDCCESAVVLLLCFHGTAAGSMCDRCGIAWELL